MLSVLEMLVLNQPKHSAKFFHFDILFVVCECVDQLSMLLDFHMVMQNETTVLRFP